VKILIDSHALLWFGWNDIHLGQKARKIMSDSGNELLFSSGSMWELAIKAGLGKLKLMADYRAFMQQAIESLDLALLPISLEHTARLSVLPLHHRDPFDRLLAAQAIVEQVPILSADVAFDAYPVQRVW
jgi:PIN domain nuclease of toxin-antitoxin system